MPHHDGSPDWVFPGAYCLQVDSGNTYVIVSVSLPEHWEFLSGPFTRQVQVTQITELGDAAVLSFTMAQFLTLFRPNNTADQTLHLVPMVGATGIFFDSNVNATRPFQITDISDEGIELDFDTELTLLRMEVFRAGVIVLEMPRLLPGATTTEGTLTRVDLREERSGFRVGWVNQDNQSYPYHYDQLVTGAPPISVDESRWVASDGDNVVCIDNTIGTHLFGVVTSAQGSTFGLDLIGSRARLTIDRYGISSVLRLEYTYRVHFGPPILRVFPAGVLFEVDGFIFGVLTSEHHPQTQSIVVASNFYVSSAEEEHTELLHEMLLRARVYNPSANASLVEPFTTRPLVGFQRLKKDLAVEPEPPRRTVFERLLDDV